MLREALRGREPSTLVGSVELAALELCLLLPVWVIGSVVLGVDLPSWGAIVLLAVGWVVVSVLRFALFRLHRR
ncbi:hypothetical protein RKE38_14125 [Phycicoccus sp. M110.8]|uniref:hypothetical protein n=1 Tax=Phycicoccus sp. M110.8 TaxID=3075433 RepID=UPI0028FD408A|nr:hypothetical protein [Phycicoccus sp. M110.8]MDU0314832.1 hypothetical protein [Phycicoccus sp. M110.8]